MIIGLGEQIKVEKSCEASQSQMKRMSSVPIMQTKTNHVMGPSNPSTERSVGKNFVMEDMYPDEEPVYEVSDVSLSSCDFKEL